MATPPTKEELQAAAKRRAEEQRKRREEAAMRAAKDAEKLRESQDAYKASGGQGMKRGGKVKKYAKGGSVGGDGICRVKTKGRYI